MKTIGLILLAGLLTTMAVPNTFASEIHCSTDGSHFIYQANIDFTLSLSPQDGSYHAVLKTENFGKVKEYVSIAPLDCRIGAQDPLIFECFEKKDPFYAGRPVESERHSDLSVEDQQPIISYELNLLLNEKVGSVLQDSQVSFSPKFIASECTVTQ